METKFNIPGLETMLRELQLANEAFDRDQLIEAVKQAIVCGDFVKYMVASNAPPDGAWIGMLRTIGQEPSGKYTVSMNSTVVYEPFREAERLRDKIDSAKRLVWEGNEADTPMGTYYLDADPVNGHSWSNWVNCDDKFPTLLEARAAAEADWAGRVEALFSGAGGEL